MLIVQILIMIKYLIPVYHCLSFADETCDGESPIVHCWYTAMMLPASLQLCPRICNNIRTFVSFYQGPVKNSKRYWQV